MSTPRLIRDSKLIRGEVQRRYISRQEQLERHAERMRESNPGLRYREACTAYWAQMGPQERRARTEAARRSM